MEKLAFLFQLKPAIYHPPAEAGESLLVLVEKCFREEEKHLEIGDVNVLFIN
ncbi:MAG: hypothetical protein IKF49_00795 [Clostridia bacterium]|nr:hypothetical protein [Clostridia bacterium]